MKIVDAPRLSEPSGPHGEHLYVGNWDGGRVLREGARHIDYPEYVFAHGSFWEFSRSLDEPCVRYDRLCAVGLERLELR